MKKVCMMVTNPCVNDARVLKEATTLSENGFNVVILAILGDGLSPYQKTKSFSIKRIHRIFKPNSFLGKLEFSLKFSIFGIVEKADIYHAHDLSTLLESFIASKINRAKIVYDSHELYISNYGKKSIGTTLYSILEKALIKNVQQVITVNDHIGDVLFSRYNLRKNPVIVMNSPKLNDSNLASNDRIINTDQNIILYQGTMQKGRGLNNLILAMNYLSDDYFLLMVGDGNIRKELEDLSCDNPNIRFTGMISLHELSRYTKCADLGVILFENESWNNYYASPNKLFEYIHSEIPILAPNYPFIENIINTYKVGCLIENIDPETIAESIKSIFADNNLYENMKKNTLTAKIDLNWEIEEQKLIHLYDQL